MHQRRMSFMVHLEKGEIRQMIVCSVDRKKGLMLDETYDIWF